MATGVVPNVQAALIGCLMMGLFRCIDLDGAYRSIQMKSLIMIVGMMPFALALDRTGGVDMAADFLVGVLGNSSEHLILGVLFAITVLLGMFIVNTANAVLLIPLALAIAEELQASPYPFAMIIALGGLQRLHDPGLAGQYTGDHGGQLSPRGLHPHRAAADADRRCHQRRHGALAAAVVSGRGGLTQPVQIGESEPFGAILARDATVPPERAITHPQLLGTRDKRFCSVQHLMGSPASAAVRAQAPNVHLRSGRARCFDVGAQLVMLILCICLPAMGRADMGQLRYAVDIATLDDAMLDAAVERASMLVALQDEPVLPVALITRAETDRIRVDDVLRSFGYYDAVIHVQVDGLDLADQTLPAVLSAGQGNRPVPVRVRIDRGPLYRLGEVELAGDVPSAAKAVFHLHPGEPAEARLVLTAGADMLEALREDGFALARVPPPLATVDHNTRRMDVRYAVEPGPRVAIGAIEVEGLERLSDAFVRRRLGLAPGDAFSPSRLEQARQDLAASGAIASVRLIPATAVDAAGRLPLRVTVVEAKRRAIRVAAAYASDDGASLLLGWTHRNLFGRAERLSLRSEVGTIDGGSRDDLDYRLGASLRLPDLWRRNLDLAFDLGAVRESLKAYDRDAITLGGALERRMSRHFSLSLGAAFERSRIMQDGPWERFDLLSLSMTTAWDGTDNPRAPRQGLRASASLVPVPWVKGESEPFARVGLTAAGYLDLARGGQSGRGEPPLPPQANAAAGDTMLAGRIALGRILGADASDVPPDWRLYAGGAGSVRGYPYQSIGPRTARKQPAGGDASLEASVELRRRLGGPWGMVVFSDLGSVTEDGLTDLDGFKVGIGLGVRFHTVIGPLRADLAVPLEPYPGDASAQLYLGIGEAF
jgi:translocation and assembly module TamA